MFGCQFRVWVSHGKSVKSRRNLLKIRRSKRFRRKIGKNRPSGCRCNALNTPASGPPPAASYPGGLRYAHTHAKLCAKYYWYTPQSTRMPLSLQWITWGQLPFVGWAEKKIARQVNGAIVEASQQTWRTYEMNTQSNATVLDTYVAITYLCVAIHPERGASANGSGSRRIWLSELPQWLAERPGTMIVSIAPAWLPSLALLTRG